MANLKLSQERADAVRNALIHAGVDSSALVAKGYGSADPVASNDTEEGGTRAAASTITLTELETPNIFTERTRK